ncbi:hypothetical protein LR48_Vigan02g025400 [Vigna angularis]|uniref:Seed maturation protein n=2 Tax=Phaseolus angularis TaxID=3914 RepID=A0A0L9TVA0_PHAAN|nr:18 kDa seed maturation protein [Vigna angularis]KAG2403463.1 seed maturation protein [Vigna angularis]KOM34104.1 hypothetical protein LR48_Vigan02g025400 [Vigna angularis]BAT96445.1 hypothetical protein VIGAN_08338800 [Vigna angularis var. angularis]
MQAAKKAVESVKETAANIGASAKSGLEKTKATLQEKSEKISAHDEREKEMATKKKQEKINQAETEKCQARQHNAAAKQSAIAGQADGPQTETTEPSSGPDDATYTGPGSETSAFTTTGPGPDAIPPSTGSELGLGAESAMYPTSEFGQMGSNQATGMPGPDNRYVLDHGPEAGHGSLPSMDSNTVMDTTTQTSIGGGSAPTSGPTFS